MDDETIMDPTNREQPGLLDRLGNALGGSDEGDAPRAVDTSTPPLETRNRVPVDEPYPATGVNAQPYNPGAGTTDQAQIPTLTHPDAPMPPLGPDTLTGSRLTNMPTPRTPHADLDPTDTAAGMYGGAAQGGQKLVDEDEDK